MEQRKVKRLNHLLNQNEEFTTMIENIIKNLETLRTLLAREAAIARAEANTDLKANLDVPSFRNSVSVFDYATNRVAIQKSLSWTGEISHASTSLDYDFKGRQLTTAEMNFVSSVTQPV